MTLGPVDQKKKNAADHAVSLITNGMKVGLGTGSTAKFAVEALGRRIKAEGLKVKGVPTSEATRKLALEQGVPLLSFEEADRLDLCIDGADEADAGLNLTKGGGGALLREKVVAFVSERFYCVVDDAKLVDKLHAFPLPLEVVPFAEKVVARELVRLGGQPMLRTRDGAPYLTDNGLWILDCRFPPIDDPPMLARALSSIPGIAEHGLFCGLTHALVVGTDQGVKVIER
ncbi:MAG: ribose-5-phosphate isomerase RpiA [Deltaproteobacteria bacterium]|nr:ribose-5-phosphate isomerase RpiA [Deltaproteobacteria bacterium]